MARCKNFTPKRCAADIKWLYNNGGFDRKGFKHYTPGGNELTWMLEKLSATSYFLVDSKMQAFAKKMASMRKRRETAIDKKAA